MSTTGLLTQNPRVVRFRGQAPTQTGIVIDIDVPWITHIEGNLWQGGCANGLMLPDDIKHVVSLYPWEQYRIEHEIKSVSFHSLLDRLDEPPPIVHGIAAYVDACEQDDVTLVHCQAGLNRSSLIAALVLMRRGRSADEAITLLRKQRSPAVLFNHSFESWLRGLA